uniref:Uncharacterized protein n=1 Tax=Anguilla anguilla TaxID=7936 RepID=A0A0E9UUP8_ANGAN
MCVLESRLSPKFLGLVQTGAKVSESIQKKVEKWLRWG